MTWRIPVNVPTRLLGSGKTILHARLLRDPLFKNGVVLIDEFRGIGIDYQ